MQKKKKQILDVAIRLFARQGFHATSIQDIVDELGMAKGSIYFYFKSKDELLVSAFQYYGEQMMSGMSEYPGEEELPPRERLRLQLERQFRFLQEHADFILMLIKEQFTGEHHEFMRTIGFRFRIHYLNWLHQHVRSIYGTEAERCWADGVMLLGGLMNRYMESITLDRDVVDIHRLPGFLLRRLDDVMNGMLASGEEPIVTNGGFRQMTALGLKGEGADIQTAVESLKKLTSGTDAEDTVRMLAAELNKAMPNRVVVRAFMALLEKQAEPDWRETLDRLAQLLTTK